MSSYVYKPQNLKTLFLCFYESVKIEFETIRSARVLLQLQHSLNNLGEKNPMSTKSTKLPYMSSVGLTSKILEKIQNARRPDRFTQDFLETKLGYTGGSARPIIPLLKRLGFLGSDGSPTALYNQFRNTETQGIALAQGMKNAFSELFDRNEYVYDMSRSQLTSLVVEVTGGTKEDSKIKAIVGTFSALKDLADFESDATLKPADEQKTEVSETVQPTTTADVDYTVGTGKSVDFKVSYTINLNLPETTNPDVFNAIFKALRENLLKN